MSPNLFRRTRPPAVFHGQRRTDELTAASYDRSCNGPACGQSCCTWGNASSCVQSSVSSVDGSAFFNPQRPLPASWTGNDNLQKINRAGEFSWTGLAMQANAFPVFAINPTPGRPRTGNHNNNCNNDLHQTSPANQLHSANKGPASSFRKKSRPGCIGMNVDGIQGVGSCRSVIHNESPCHIIPRPKVPSAPPMILSHPRNNPGPIVLANAGTCVVRLLKLVNAFCSTVSG